MPTEPEAHEPAATASVPASAAVGQANDPVVVGANVKVHTQLADQYNESEPHFRPENQAKVRRRLEALAARGPGERLLDMGCGTGFILHLAKDLFARLDGVDATPAMLQRVDLSSGNIYLHEGVVEAVPFEDATFDLVTAYSFLDHLADHRLMLTEALRVLRPGGLLYVDLVPNRDFWDAIYAASQSSRTDGADEDPIVAREIHELVNHEQKLQDQFGIDPEDWRNAEPAKSEGQGFDPADLQAEVASLGFTAVEVRHEWFLGQAVVHHQDSPEAAATVDAHLRRLLPVSSPLFKYLVLTAEKP